MHLLVDHGGWGFTLLGGLKIPWPLFDEMLHFFVGSDRLFDVDLCVLVLSAKWR